MISTVCSTLFLTYVKQLYDRHFPVIDVKYRYDKSKSPWMSEGIYNSIRRKNHLYKKEIQEKNNIKGTWKLINSLLNKHKQSLNPTYFCTDDNNKITASKDIADALNKYFVDIGSNLASKLPLCNTPVETFLGARCSNSLFLTPITQGEIATLNKR